MRRRLHISHPGFTLLELCIAIAIAAMLIMVAVPSVTAIFNKTKDQSGFTSFDQMVQDAHVRSVAERRPYILVWTRKEVLLRADGSDEKDAGAVVRRWSIDKDDSLILDLRAALLKNPEAVWTFWANGVCEPASIFYKGKAGKWSAAYNPFTAQAVVRYD